MKSFASVPAITLGFAQSAKLASTGPSTTAVSAVAAAVSIPFIALHARPGCFTARADASWPRPPAGFAISPSTGHVILSCDRIDAASPAETGHYLQEAWAVVRSILSVFHPRNLAIVLCKHLALQSLLKFNQYMLQLLEHEKRALEAEEQGQTVSDPPPIPDFKPSFNQGAKNAARELSVCTVRKLYEVCTVKRLGATRAMPFLRDYRMWIRDVLAFKHRLDSPGVRYFKYLFATLHGSALYYAADATVAIALVVRAALLHRPRKRSDLIVIVLRGALAQVVVCVLRFSIAAVGGSLASLVRPGVGTAIGTLMFDIAASSATAPLAVLIAGPHMG